MGEKDLTLDYFREYATKNWGSYSDFQLAGIINKVAIHFDKKLSLYKQLAEQTDDEKLKKQLKDIVGIREKGFDSFIRQDDGCVYVTINLSEGETVGYSSNYSTALNIAKDGTNDHYDDFQIEKHRILNEIPEDTTVKAWSTHICLEALPWRIARFVVLKVT